MEHVAEPVKAIDNPVSNDTGNGLDVAVVGDDRTPMMGPTPGVNES